MYESNHGAISQGYNAKADVMPKKPSQMDTAFNSVESAQEQTNELLAVMERKLDQVLAKSRPVEDKDPEAEVSWTCPLHERVLHAGSRQRRLNKRMQELIDRIGL